MNKISRDRVARIEVALREQRPDLADMYLSARLMLAEASEPGGDRTRVAFICHAMREVMVGTVRVMGKSSSPRVKPTSSDQVQALPALLSRYSDLDLGDGASTVPVPAPMAAALNRLIATAVNEARRIRFDVASLLTDDSNEAHATVALWIATNKFFVSWAHLHDEDSSVESLPADRELETRIEVFEELMDGVVTDFFATQHIVAKLLAEINAEFGGEGTHD